MQNYGARERLDEGQKKGKKGLKLIELIFVIENICCVKEMKFL